MHCLYLDAAEMDLYDYMDCDTCDTCKPKSTRFTINLRKQCIRDWQNQWISCIFGDETTTNNTVIYIVKDSIHSNNTAKAKSKNAKRLQVRFKDPMEEVCMNGELVFNRTGEIDTEMSSSANTAENNNNVLTILEDQDDTTDARFTTLKDEEATPTCDTTCDSDTETTDETDGALRLHDDVTDDARFTILEDGQTTSTCNTTCDLDIRTTDVKGIEEIDDHTESNGL